MRGSLLLLFLVTLFASASGGEKFSPRLDAALAAGAGGNGTIVAWVYFADKGGKTLLPGELPAGLVSPRSIERRARVLPAENLVDATDLPVYEPYVRDVEANVLRLRQISKWFNGVSVEATALQLRRIEELPFVREVDLVYRAGKPGARRQLEDPMDAPAGSLSKTNGTTALDYGFSLAQVALENIPSVHSTGNSASGIIICSMDNGFRLLAHQAFDSLRSRIIATYDFVDHKVSVVPKNTAVTFGEHGINTLSVMAGFFPGQLIGPAYGASFLLARTENDSSETPVEEDNWVRAIEWADSQGVQVTSTSLGYDVYDAPYKSWTWADMNGRTTLISKAAVMAARKGIIVVNSAGNEGVNRSGDPNSLTAPADADSILSVGAVTPAGTLLSFSSYGPTVDGRTKPDVVATGSSIYAASPTTVNGYVVTQGTSFSCPLTAGVAALVLKAHPTASVMQIIGAIKATASRASAPTRKEGWGIVNALAAINALGPTDSGGSGTLHPSTFVLDQNFPNPFNPGTRVNFLLPEASHVTIRVYDLLGKELKTLVSGDFPGSGTVPYQASWDGSNASGGAVASGVYICRLEARGQSGTSAVRTVKMMLVR
jgi:subtilisin family serine protease